MRWVDGFETATISLSLDCAGQREVARHGQGRGREMCGEQTWRHRRSRHGVGELVTCNDDRDSQYHGRHRKHCLPPTVYAHMIALPNADKKRAYSAQPALSSPRPLVASGWIHRPGVTFHLHSPLKPTLFPPPLQSASAGLVRYHHALYPLLALLSLSSRLAPALAVV